MFKETNYQEFMLRIKTMFMFGEVSADL